MRLTIHIKWCDMYKFQLKTECKKKQKTVLTSYWSKAPVPVV